MIKAIKMISDIETDLKELQLVVVSKHKWAAEVVDKVTDAFTNLLEWFYQ